MYCKVNVHCKQLFNEKFVQLIIVLLIDFFTDIGWKCKRHYFSWILCDSEKKTIILKWTSSIIYSVFLTSVKNLFGIIKRWIHFLLLCRPLPMKTLFRYTRNWSLNSFRINYTERKCSFSMLDLFAKFIIQCSLPPEYVVNILLSE